MYFRLEKKMAPTALSERLKQSVTKDALRSYFAEFISTFFYVFAVVGSSMASSKCARNQLLNLSMVPNVIT